MGFFKIRKNKKMYEEIEIPPYKEIVNGNGHGISRNKTITSQAAGQTEIQPLRAEDRAAEWRAAQWRAQFEPPSGGANEASESSKCGKCCYCKMLLLLVVLIIWIIFYINGVIIIPIPRG